MGRSVFEYHEQQMRDNPEYKAAYDALEQEFAIAAEKLGVSQPAVARMESGKNISIKAIARYAKAVGRPINLSILPV